MTASPAASDPAVRPATTWGKIYRGVILVAVFWTLTADYLFVYFSTDDLMNLYHSVGVGKGVWRGLVLFWSSRFTRPGGDALYLGLYSLFGLHPFGFKLFMVLLLTANLLLAWQIAARLLGDSGLGALAALLFLYHPSVPGDDVYNFGNFATIYDMACFAFLYAAFWVWLRARRAERFPGPAAVILIGLLQILALGAKEMAVALPALIFLKEMLGGDLVSWKKRRIEWRAIPTLALLSVITLAFLIGKSRGAGSLLNNPAYRPTLSLHVYLDNMSHYLNQLFYCGAFFRSNVTSWFLCGGLALAALLRARIAIFGWLWFLVTTLPVAFIPGRAGMVLYIPVLALAVGIADLGRAVFHKTIGKARGRLSHYLDPAAPPVFLVAVACFTPFLWHVKARGDAAANGEARVFGRFAADLQAAGRSHTNASLVFLHDPFDSDRFDGEFMATLLWREHSLKVGRVKRNQALLSPSALAMFDDMYDYDRGHVRRVPPGSNSGRLGELRAAAGYADPVSGIYLAPANSWWVRKDFAIAVHCKSTETECQVRLVVLGLTSDGGRSLSVDIAGVHWRDIQITAGSEQAIEIPVPATRPVTQLSFHESPPQEGSDMFITGLQIQ